MAYYCPFCGEEAYRGHRDYKCGNGECDNHQNPVFTLEGKPIASEEVEDAVSRLERHGLSVNVSAE